MAWRLQCREPLNCCRRGNAAGYFSRNILWGISAMDEVVEALSGGIVAELLYLLVGDLAAPFDRSAQRGIVVLCWIVPGVTALVEDDGLFCLSASSAATITQAHTGSHREKVLHFHCVFGHWIFSC